MDQRIIRGTSSIPLEGQAAVQPQPWPRVWFLLGMRTMAAARFASQQVNAVLSGNRIPQLLARARELNRTTQDWHTYRPELKLRAQGTKGTEVPCEPGLPGFVARARRLIAGQRAGPVVSECTNVPWFDLAQQAITLDETLLFPHSLSGLVYMWKKQHSQAITEGEQAIALNLNNAESHMTRGAILAFAGRAEEGIRSIEQAMRLNPRYPVEYIFQLSVACRMAGRYEEALAPGKKYVAANPNSGPGHFNLAVIYSELGQIEKAQAEVAEMLRRVPHRSVEFFRQFLPFKDPAVLERTLAALHKAGLK